MSEANKEIEVTPRAMELLSNELQEEWRKLVLPYLKEGGWERVSHVHYWERADKGKAGFTTTIHKGISTEVVVSTMTQEEMDERTSR